MSYRPARPFRGDTSRVDRVGSGFTPEEALLVSRGYTPVADPAEGNRIPPGLLRVNNVLTTGCPPLDRETCLQTAASRFRGSQSRYRISAPRGAVVILSRPGSRAARKTESAASESAPPQEKI